MRQFIGSRPGVAAVYDTKCKKWLHPADVIPVASEHVCTYCDSTAIHDRRIAVASRCENQSPVQLYVL
eukprot:gene5673-7246_t